MSCDLQFPIDFVIIDDGSGEVKLREEVILSSQVLQDIDTGEIRVSACWLLDLGDRKVAIDFLQSSRDSFFHDAVGFSGFYSTAMEIVSFLGVPKGSYTID